MLYVNYPLQKKDTQKRIKYINRWMAKEDVVNIYNGLLLSHKKEQNWVVCGDMDGPRDCHTKWSKSGRVKQKCILMHICGI